MSDRRPLCHLIYTNAPGQGGSGFRFLAVGFPGSEAERREIEGWLMGLKLAGEQQTGWAASSFLVNRSPCFALAVVDRTRFPLDDLGRPGGILAHALLLQIEEGKPVGDFGLATFDKAKGFLEERSGSSTLDNYLVGCRTITDLEIPEIQFNNFRGLDKRFLQTFYAVTCSGGDSEVSFPGVVSDDDLPEPLLVAACALPPRLRLTLSWRVGVVPGKGGFVAHAALPGALAPLLGNLGTSYLDAVWTELGFGNDTRVASFAAGDWSVKSWNGLPQALARQEVEEQVIVADSPAQLEESDDMANKGRSARSKPAVTPRQKSPATYDDEYQAIYQDLKGYFEGRLLQMGAPPAPSSSSTPPYVPPGSAEGDLRPAVRLYRAWRPEIYFLILLLLGIVAYWNPRQPVSDGKAKEPPVTTPTTSPTPVKSPTNPVPTQPTSPSTDWKAFVESPEAVDWFQAVAEARGLASSQVTGLRKADFSGWTEKLKKTQPLTQAELTSSRVGFFEYAHARWAKDKGLGDVRRDQVTLAPSEAAPHLQAMAQDLGLTLDPKSTVDDPKVQAAVVLAWIRQHTSP